MSHMSVSAHFLGTHSQKWNYQVKEHKYFEDTCLIVPNSFPKQLHWFRLLPTLYDIWVPYFKRFTNGVSQLLLLLFFFFLNCDPTVKICVEITLLCLCYRNPGSCSRSQRMNFENTQAASRQKSITGKQIAPSTDTGRGRKSAPFCCSMEVILS